MSANDPLPDAVRRRPSRRLIIIAALVVAAALVTALVLGLQSGRTAPAPRAVGSSFATVAPQPSVRVTVPPTVRATAPIVAPLPSGSARPGTTSSPVPIASPATPVSRLVVRIGSLASVAGKGDGIGEVDAPAIRFVVTVDNQRSAAVSLSSAVVTVTYGADETPADEYVSVRKGLPQSVAAGQKVAGTFEFAVPRSARKNVSIAFDYQVGTPITVFSGRVPS